MGLLDFNKQLEVLVPKPGRGAITNPQAFNKTDVFPGIYAISEDLDSKYVLQIWSCQLWNTKPIRFQG
jgi:lipoprotein-releasing system permease protein